VGHGRPGHDPDPGAAGRPASADLIERSDDLGRLAPGHLADVIGVPGDPTADITCTQDVRFVMKDGQVHLRP
jgi:imidazolonepropionase-like amidohydrolase